MKTIRDAVHGDISLSDELMTLVDTRAFQRLRGIKQLGTSSLVYPSAVHTRFEHSLGTAWMTGRLIDRLRQSGFPVDADEARVATMAGLLHDITHVPFGHTFEDERRLFDRHDEDPDRLSRFLLRSDLAEPLAETGLADRVSRVLAPESVERGAVADRPLLGDLFRGTVGADLLDYLKRDARHAGLTLDYDDRILHYFAVARDRLVFRLHKSGSFRRDAVSELVHLLQIRYTLTERVYYHHAKVVAGAMVSRALELALAAGVISKSDLYRLRDDGLFTRLRQLEAEVPGLADLLDDFESRRLYKRVYLLTLEGLGRPGLSAVERDELAREYHDQPARRAEAERRLASELGVPESHVIIYCPSARMSLKEANVPVETGPGQVEPLAELRHPDVEALVDKHRGLWRMFVCLRRTHPDRFTRAVAACEELFGQPNRLGVSGLPGC